MGFRQRTSGVDITPNPPEIWHRLFTVDVSDEHVVSVLEGYANLGEIVQVHNNIRKFVKSGSLFHLGKDNVLNEIIDIRLIEIHKMKLWL